MLAHILILTLKLLQQAKDHCPILGLAEGLSFWKAKKNGNFTQKRRKHRHTFCFIERHRVAHQKRNRNNMSTIFSQQIISGRLLLVVIIREKN